MEKMQIGLLVTTSRPFNYDCTKVTIIGGTPEWITDRIAGTVDNKAGYGDLEACERVALRMQALKNEGYVQLFNDALFYLHMSVEYQHFSPDKFCNPNVSLGSYPRYISAAIPVFKKLQRGTGYEPFPKSPDELIAKFKGAYKLILKDYDFVIDEPKAIREARKVNFNFEQSQVST